MYADVYVSSLDGDEVREQVMTGLDSARGYLRRELGNQLRLQHTPELRFKWDESLTYGDHIESLLSSLDIPPTDDPDGNDNSK
jgi:ribosome-binding factor A